MSEETTIRVNFSRPIPLFPLNVVVLMPHGVFPFLRIFEDRYVQMVSDALDGPGQIAMALFEGDQWKEEYHGKPPLRPAVCIAQIVQHHKLPDGQYHLAVQGICRARVVNEVPAEDGVLYRRAMLEPIGLPSEDESSLEPYRERFKEMLSQPPMTDLRDAPATLEHLSSDEIPTSAIMELLTLSFIPDTEIRYRLLEEADPAARARIIERELRSLRDVLIRAAPQRKVEPEPPKGCSWN